MTIKNRTNLKAQTEDGDTADTAVFADLIDSAVNLSDTTVQSMASELKGPKFNATTEVSAVLIRTPTVSASAMHGDTGTIGGHTLAASAVTFNVPTTGAGAAAASASTFFRMTINGSVYYIPAITSV